MAAQRPPAQKKPRAGAAARKPSTTVVKISREVRDYIVAHAEWNQSVDSTLRNLLGRTFRKWLNGRAGKNGK